IAPSSFSAYAASTLNGGAIPGCVICPSDAEPTKKGRPPARKPPARPPFRVATKARAASRGGAARPDPSARAVPEAVDVERGGRGGHRRRGGRTHPSAAQPQLRPGDLNVHPYTWHDADLSVAAACARGRCLGHGGGRDPVSADGAGYVPRSRSHCGVREWQSAPHTRGCRH